MFFVLSYLKKRKKKNKIKNNYNETRRVCKDCFKKILFSEIAQSIDSLQISTCCGKVFSILAKRSIKVLSVYSQEFIFIIFYKSN